VNQRIINRKLKDSWPGPQGVQCGREIASGGECVTMLPLAQCTTTLTTMSQCVYALLAHCCHEACNAFQVRHIDGVVARFGGGALRVQSV